jgi:hypothetical protein
MKTTMHAVVGCVLSAECSAYPLVKKHRCGYGQWAVRSHYPTAFFARGSRDTGLPSYLSTLGVCVFVIGITRCPMPMPDAGVQTAQSPWPAPGAMGYV